MASVKEIMTKAVATIGTGRTVLEAAKLMDQQNVGDLVVMDEGMARGIVTERDLVRRVIAQRKPLDTKVSEVMSYPLITIEEDCSLRDAARKMVKYKIRRLPVTQDGKLVGIIATSDFAKHLSKKSFSEAVIAAMTRYPLADSSR
jgi:CBS domain-containing protein